MFGLSIEDWKILTAGMMRGQVLRWMDKIRRRRRPNPARVRPGQFICDRHWLEIEASWMTDDPVDAMSVTVGLTVACHLARQRGPQRHVCCKLNRYGWEGVIKRARPSWHAQEAI